MNNKLYHINTTLLSVKLLGYITIEFFHFVFDTADRFIFVPLWIRSEHVDTYPLHLVIRFDRKKFILQMDFLKLELPIRMWWFDVSVQLYKGELVIGIGMILAIYIRFKKPFGIYFDELSYERR